MNRFTSLLNNERLSTIKNTVKNTSKQLLKTDEISKMSKSLKNTSNSLLNSESLSNISNTLRQTSYSIRFNLFLKLLIYVGTLLLCVIIYFTLFHKSRIRWFAPSIMININKYNLEFSTKTTELIINYKKLTENQFSWTSRLQEGDIYLNLLNDDVAEIFRDIESCLKEKGFNLDSNDIYSSSRISKFLNKNFEQYKHYTNHDMNHIAFVFNQIEKLVGMEESFANFVESKYIMNFLDTTNLHHTKLLENKLFNKYAIFMSESIRDRYERIKIYHPTSVATEYMEEIVKNEENKWFFDSKDTNIVEYCLNIYIDIQETIKIILIENTNLTRNELNANDTQSQNLTSNMNMVDAEEHNSLLSETLSLFSQGINLINNTNYEMLKTEHHLKLEKYLYQTLVRKDNIHTNVFSEFDVNTILSKYRNILDIILLNEERSSIENAMDFSIHYILDADNSKLDKLNIYNQYYLQLFEYIAYHKNNYERLIRYNRSRWPIRPQLEKAYTKQFGVAYRIFIEENIGQEWSNFVHGKSTSISPILRAIENLINPTQILKSIL